MSFRRNVVALGGSAALGRIGYFVAVSVTGRRVGVADFGRFTFVLAVFLAFSLAANLGLENLAIRTSARSPHDTGAFLGAATRLRLFAVPVAFVIAVALIAREPSSTVLVVALAGYGLLNGAVQFDAAIFRGVERMELQTLVMGLQAMLTAVFVVGATTLWPVAEMAAVGYLLGAVGAAIWSTTLRRRLGHRSIAASRSEVLDLARTAAPFTIAIVGYVVFDRSVIVVLALTDTDDAVGWFGAAYVMVTALASMPVVLAHAVFPGLARAAVRSEPEQLIRLVATQVAAMVAFGCVVAITLRFSAATLVDRVYGAEYMPSVGILRSFAIVLPVLFAVIFLNVVVQAVDAQRAGAWAVGFGLLVGLPVMSWLVVDGGVERAAFAYGVPAGAMTIGLSITVIRNLAGRMTATRTEVSS